MPSLDERVQALRRAFPPRVVAAILNLDPAEVREQIVSPRRVDPPATPGYTNSDTGIPLSFIGDGYAPGWVKGTPWTLNGAIARWGHEAQFFGLYAQLVVTAQMLNAGLLDPPPSSSDRILCWAPLSWVPRAQYSASYPGYACPAAIYHYNADASVLKLLDRTAVISVESDGSIRLAEHGLNVASVVAGDRLAVVSRRDSAFAFPGEATFEPVPAATAFSPAAPAIAAGPTERSRVIRHLAVTGGRIYAGYGDYNQNTGPIHIYSVPISDPSAAWTDHLTADTEEIGRFCALSDGRILVPHMDPRGAGGGYAERQVNGVWMDRPQRIGATTAVVEHVFDMIEFGGALWACGSGGDAARVWKSTDGGATWTTDLIGQAGALSRYYGFTVKGDELLVMSNFGGGFKRWTAASGAWNDAPYADGFEAPNATDPTYWPLSYGYGFAWGGGWVTRSSLDGFEPGPQERHRVYFLHDNYGDTLEDGATDVALGDDGAIYFLIRDGIFRCQPPVMQHFSEGEGDDFYEWVETSFPQEQVATVPHIPQVHQWNTALAILPGSKQAVVGTSTGQLKVVSLNA